MPESTITQAQAKYALDNMDDYARMGGIVPSGAFQVLRAFIEQHEDRHVHLAAPSPQASPGSSAVTDAEIDALASAMPGGVDGFLKGWGWRQFARSVLDAFVARHARERIELAYEQGWCAAAEWAKRTDLYSDVDSPAYLKERGEFLADLDTAPPAPGSASPAPAEGPSDAQDAARYRWLRGANGADVIKAVLTRSSDGLTFLAHSILDSAIDAAMKESKSND